jgi:arginine decarboxylase
MKSKHKEAEIKSSVVELATESESKGAVSVAKKQVKTSSRSIDRPSSKIPQEKMAGGIIKIDYNIDIPRLPYERLWSTEGTVNLSQLRLDFWNMSREVVVRLDECFRRGEAVDASLRRDVEKIFSKALVLERFWVFPGNRVITELKDHFMAERFDLLAKLLKQVVHILSRYGDSGMRLYEEQQQTGKPIEYDEKKKQYFSVLIVDDMPESIRSTVQIGLREVEREFDEFYYDLVYVDSVEDAILAALYNHDIQACVVREDIALRSTYWTETVTNELLKEFLDEWESKEHEKSEHSQGFAPRGWLLGKCLRELRPSVDLYLLSSLSHSEAVPVFNREFYRHEDYTELHMTIIEGVRQRYRTPFFDALKRYSERPVGNFHALPIARGSSVFNSQWLQDMRLFYGDDIFLAETSATAGGLDSLLDPKGPIKEAQQLAANAFGSCQSYFVTNGTSTSNKIVVQALIEPGDIVLIDRNCHKSHHYGLVLSGGHPEYLEATWLENYAIYGGVRLETILAKLREIQKAGQLHKVKMLLLTNCTFDGVVYNPVQVMEAVLAIKSDMIFLWDEAWYAFAGFHPTSRERTGMYSAKLLEKRILERASQAHKEPDSRVRVYATQSTHKSLSAFRQGSMIHVYDWDFAQVEADFKEAYYTHSSTSPNYQLVGTLDLARLQADLEGYSMVSSAYQKALRIREVVKLDPSINKVFRVLEPNDLIPEYDHGDVKRTVDYDFSSLGNSWKDHELVLDPTRITLLTSGAGLSGNEFKVKYLMDQYGIQVNKTSLNSVLIIVTIGVTWSGVDFLLESLRKIVRKIRPAQATQEEIKEIEQEEQRHLRSQIGEAPYPEPGFSRFDENYIAYKGVTAGKIREAFFRAYRPEEVEYISLSDEGLEGRVCTRFIIPYPPGFPILVPGQVISEAILRFMRSLDVKEVHGYDAKKGLPVFVEGNLHS